MKVEIELPDLVEHYFPSKLWEENAGVTNEEIRDMFIDDGIKAFVDEMFDKGKDYYYSEAIRSEIIKLVKEHKQEIIDTVIKEITATILKNKAIVEQMPKKSEINTINKEWETYFVDLVDKAIARRFK